ncbi:BBSome-interacting protein 1 isoform 1-T4 [Salvelinus alpinus]|uniref:BBSome interacting protein 1 n=3 Tax=Oncorhynchus TaxID=8016 RepID=A0A060YMI4_ONCMY|nr:BBSome-interacting protein 1 [Oncorhynchus mykiss]XP_024261149.1 BBSome-interacting protein 1 [Oncorhynchus tshawytscha]XP_031688837.1 BBSome-interacting protein 1 [Oncorhynchus kisutch]XP_036805149.1 BBSome-interacting protein 1 [Oncorhynchus mykiss]XP_046186021.1 BBSome-interacting protein 1 [Oncorhynchus gorbuscha]XP_052358882.1 BBSome-interacting protein 1 [Oncorhynchus keta]XP_052383896.1 BBSome-interacting protein 1 [Oncorhynchus keta]XP_055773753.1 BBSome-interacting protein 1 [Sal
MPEVKSMFREVLPKQGQLSMEDVPTMVLCKPKLMPLKSVTLEKLEKMQLEAQEAIKQQDLALKEQQETQ